MSLNNATADTNICSFLDRSAKEHPDAVALCFSGAHFRYAEIYTQVNRLADSLRALGCKAGMRIAYAAGNRPEAVTVCYAAARLGAVLAPVSADGSNDETLSKLKIIAPEIVFYDEKSVRLSALAAKQVPSLRHAVVMGSAVQRRGCLRYDQLLADGRDLCSGY